MEPLELNQRVLESSTDCIKVLDLEARLIFMNGEGCKVLEIDDFGRIANAYWPDFWKGTDAAAAREAIEMAKAGGIGRFQGYCPTWKGTPKWWDVVVTPVLGPNGKPERLLAISRDITEARQAEDALRATLESIGDGFVACDAGWRFVYVNQPAERLSRKRREELLGRNFWEVFPDTVGTNVEREFRRAAAGETREFENFYEPWGCWFENRCYPRDGGGISVYFQDITERKRSQDDLREALRELEFITENMAAGVIRCSRDLRYLWVSRNYAAWHGKTPEEIAGRPIVDVIGPSGYEDIRPCVESVLSGKKEEYEAEVDYRGIGRRWIHAAYMPTRGLDGKVDGWIAIVTDITDLRRAREESFSRQNLESLGTLAGGIAHDFNNLLGAVQAQAEMAQAGLAEGSSPEEELKAIRDVAARGSEIVRELLIYAGKEGKDAELLDVSQVIAEMLELMKISVSKHATFKTDLSQNLPSIRASTAQISQLVMNLVSNASEAIGDRDGTVQVSTRRITLGPDSPEIDRLAEGEYVQLEVSDTGHGMSPETSARVFDPFFSTKSAGRGLGLSVVRGIVSKLGGTIHLSSELGHGTSFLILLPCADSLSEAMREPISDIGQPEWPSQAARVLIVEDEDPLRLATSKMLRRQGFSVIEASDGSAALDAIHAKDKPVDVLFLDVTLPKTPGREVLKEAQRLRPEMRVVVTSAYPKEMAVASLQTTVEHFVRKPYRLKELVEVIRTTLTERG
jgi:PAS domain S-box-containing protein